MIPKRIHYVWVGSPLPDAQRRNLDTWRRSNPDFELVAWDERTIDFSHPRLRQAYDKRLWAKVADIARLQALSQEGGFYFDVDFELYRPLTPLLGHACVLGFQTRTRSSDWVANGMLAAEPGHWFMRQALQRVLSIRPIPFGFDRPTRYGPKLVTQLLVEHGLDHYDESGVQLKDILICPVESFFPWPFGEAFRDGFTTHGTYGMHLWEKSWEKDVPPWVRLAKRVRKRTLSMLRPAV